MATEILAIGSTAAQSTDQTLAAGATATLVLKSAAGTPAMSAFVGVELKTSSGTYVHVGLLTLNQRDPQVAATLQGPCVFRVSRQALSAGNACGVDLA